MYRSRPIVLVIFTVLAACSTRDDSAAVAGLAQDTTLARLGQRPEEAQTLPSACGTVEVAAKPAVVNDLAAKDLARQAYDAELLGYVGQAQSLLRHATELDGTNQALAYHLGRTSESLGDRDGAMSAYCHYLTLASTAPGAADARQRVMKLALSQGNVTTNVATSPPSVTPSVSSSTHRAAPRRSPAAYRVAAVAARPSSAHAILPGSGTQSAGVGSSSGDDSSESAGVVHRTSSDGDVVATSAELPATQPATARRRGPTRVQGAGIGAVAGAIIGAVAGRNVKSTAIGAAAGGILGTVVAGAAH